MLDDFKEEYKIAYRILMNDIKKEKCSHAYLFETNGNKDGENFIFSFIKCVLCPFHYSNSLKCDECFQCHNIDNNNYLEIKIIQPDGMWIKKEQLISLQEEFMTKGIENQKRIYIIKQAHRMNSAAANSILKFLEEPQNNIMAILITDNIHQLLPTIISRCKILNLNCNKSESNDIKQYLSKKYDSIDQFNKIFLNTIQFVEYLEKYKKRTIVYEKKLFFDFFREKEDIITFFELLIFYYKDVVNCKLNRKNIFIEKIDQTIIENNTVNSLSHKINLLIYYKDKLNLNANQNLLIDRMIIDIGGV